MSVAKFTQDKLKDVDLQIATQYSLQNSDVRESLGERKIERSNYVFYPEF